jgi:hypothetical protein
MGVVEGGGAGVLMLAAEMNIGKLEDAPH